MSSIEHVDLRVIQVLEWPKDKAIIATLSLEEKICWYSGQPPQKMVFMGQDKTFKRFWYWTYLIPLRCKRYFYKTKRILSIKVF